MVLFAATQTYTQHNEAVFHTGFQYISAKHLLNLSLLRISTAIIRKDPRAAVHVRNTCGNAGRHTEIKSVNTEIKKKNKQT